MQPDTIIPDLSNPQSWNRYSYVTNRPVNFSDPTGHDYCDYYPSACSVNYQHGSGLNGNPLDPNNLGDYGSNDKKDKNEDDTVTILVCGFDTGEKCDHYSSAYGDRPLAPYSYLSNDFRYFGFVGSNNDDKKKWAKAIYDEIVNHPQITYNLVGHSAGGSVVILALEQLLEEGHMDQVKNVVLLDPAIQTLPDIDGSGSVDLQTAANSISATGIPVFLGDSPTDGPDSITGAIDGGYHTNSDPRLVELGLDHLALSTSYDLYNLIVTNDAWRP